MLQKTSGERPTRASTAFAAQNACRWREARHGVFTPDYAVD